MNKTFFYFIFFIVIGTQALAQTSTGSSEKYGKTLNLGVGIGYSGYRGHSGAALMLNYEFDVAPYFTLAPFIAYYSYSNSYYWGNKNYPYRNYTYRETSIPIGVKGAYYFDKLLEEYGEPNKVLIEINEASSATHNFAGVYVLYEDKHILATYSFSRLKADDSVNLCLLNYYFENSISEIQMILWAPNTELNFDLATLKPLEKVSEISIGAFYEKFKEEENKCFEISKEAWN